MDDVLVILFLDKLILVKCSAYPRRTVCKRLLHKNSSPRLHGSVYAKCVKWFDESFKTRWGNDIFSCSVSNGLLESLSTSYCPLDLVCSINEVSSSMLLLNSKSDSKLFWNTYGSRCAIWLLARFMCTSLGHFTERAFASHMLNQIVRKIQRSYALRSRKTTAHSSVVSNYCWNTQIPIRP